MPEKTQEQMIQETHDTVIQLKTVLLGVNGDHGLVGEVQSVRKKVNKVTIMLYGLIGVLTGAGIIDSTVTHLVIGG